MSKIIEKVTAFITRKSRDGDDLLLFEHPNAGIQIPAGTVEDQEIPEEAYCERVQPIRLCFQRMKVPPWELSVHLGSHIRLAGGRPNAGKLGCTSTQTLAKAEGAVSVGRATMQAVV